MLILAGYLVSCKKKDYVNPYNLCSTGNCNYRPPQFYFDLADSKGQSLLPPGTDGIRVSYRQNGQSVGGNDATYPYKTNAGATTSFLLNMGGLVLLSEGGTKTFYLNYRGKIDTLGLDAHAVTPITADNGGHSIPIITFNGRPMQSVPGGTDTPDYFVLKRR